MYKFIILLISLFVIASLKADNGISAKLIKATSDTQIEAPKYPGGENALYDYLSKNIRYPELLVKIKMEGEVDIKFTVTKDGDINKVEIIRGFDPLADDEVLRVVQKMPKWEPATIDAQGIDSDQKMTITFTITDELVERLNNPENVVQEDTPLTVEITDKENEDEVISQVSDTLLNREPQFPGGTKAMEEYFKSNMKYPKRAIKYKVEGRVLYNILVSEEGEIMRIALLRGIFSDCNEEAFFLIKKMPRWIPGLKDGKPTTMSVIVPVAFELPN